MLLVSLILVLTRTAVAAPKKHKPVQRMLRHSGAAAHSDLLEGIVRGGPWTEPTYAESSSGDNVEGEDPVIRQAAVGALGRYNGSIVIVDTSNGRILTIVNQRVALSSAFQPCSTIKISVALAALSEKLILPGTKLQLYGKQIDLTYALAHSSNYFFARLGEQLGFQKFSYYAHQFGYGQKSGLNIPTETAGHFPSAPPHNGGMGMLTSFGEEIAQTPLQLAALMSAVANGGTLYYLQYPRTHLEDCKFVPRVKRQLFINSIILGITPGLLGAVEFGTAHRARQDEPIAGKTGTCTEGHAHLGWFGSFSDVGGRRLAVVVLLMGGRLASSAQASAIAGNIYYQLQKNSVLFSDGRQASERLITQTDRRLGCESSERLRDRMLPLHFSRGEGAFVLGIVGTVAGWWLFRVFRGRG